MEINVLQMHFRQQLLKRLLALLVEPQVPFQA
jgi:hypothetical protein